MGDGVLLTFDGSFVVGISVGDAVFDDSIFSLSKFANPSSFSQLSSSGLSPSSCRSFNGADDAAATEPQEAMTWAAKNIAKENRFILRKYFANY